MGLKSADPNLFASFETLSTRELERLLSQMKRQGDRTACAMIQEVLGKREEAEGEQCPSSS